MIVDCAVYEDGRRRDGDVDLHDAYGVPAATEVRLDRAVRADRGGVRVAPREFDLHPLAVEDAIHAHQRPKLEVFGDMVFLVLKTARYVDPTRSWSSARS